MRRRFVSELCVLAAIAAFSSFNSTASAQDFNYRNMMLARMKLDKSFDYDAYADSYMQAFRPVVYKTYRNDEFQFRRKKRETVELMKQATKEFKLETQMTIKGTMTLGQYDFDKQQFPVKEATDTHYWYVNHSGGRGDLPYRYAVYLQNPELIKAVPMKENIAEQFIQNRKSRSGSINRVVQAAIKFKIDKMKNGKDEFFVYIQSAQFFDDKGRTRLIHEVKLPPKKKPNPAESITKGEKEKAEEAATSEQATPAATPAAASSN